jgi:hypothetical protein
MSERPCPKDSQCAPRKDPPLSWDKGSFLLKSPLVHGDPAALAGLPTSYLRFPEGSMAQEGVLFL